MKMGVIRRTTFLADKVWIGVRESGPPYGEYNLFVSLDAIPGEDFPKGEEISWDDEKLRFLGKECLLMQKSRSLVSSAILMPFLD